MNNRIWIGVDIGSVSVKLAVFYQNSGKTLPYSLKNSGFFKTNITFQINNFSGTFIFSDYKRHHGNPEEITIKLLDDLFNIIPKKNINSITLTGSGGRNLKQKFNFGYINEFRASATGIGLLYPEVNTIFEIGGELSKYILISHMPDNNIQIIDYEVNGECAAGTGSFFDQQAERLKYSVKEAGKAASETKRSASIAGRCSVFAKSDMIHAQQRGYTPPEVLRGLCEAVVRNYKGSITKGKEINPKTAFIGGVAFNKSFSDIFREHFNFNEENFMVPDYPAWISAAGAALYEANNGSNKRKNFNINLSSENQNKFPVSSPLSLDKVILMRDRITPYRFNGHEKIPAYLGIDIGSVSTNLALIDSSGNVIQSIYRMTEGRPVEIVKDSLLKIAENIGDRVMIKGAGTTGSGRELIGLLIGADVIKDEITAHKTGAMHISKSLLNKKIDTIFEIGGQDSKFISIKDGIVIDFTLNEACAAGTGSFLEEQAKKLKINIKDEFAHLALQSKHPLKLGERCTVFMEKELTPYLQHGVSKEDVASGLALSVVLNYLNRVVKKRKIGNVIFFQGGTAFNDSVAAAFSTILDKEIIVPPYNGILGAIGAALLSIKKETNSNKTSFRGWDINKISWQLEEFECGHCSNNCTIQKFTVEGESSFWGDKCSTRYRKQIKTGKKPVIDDLFEYRNNHFYSFPHKQKKTDLKRSIIGIPRALSTYDRLPFWYHYFTSLGFKVKLSPPSTKKLINAGAEAVVAQPCFPVQLAHGHLAELLKMDVDHIFLPNLVSEENPSNSINSFICPWTQTLPLIAIQTPALSGIKKKLIYPNIQFRMGIDFVEKKMLQSLTSLGIGKRENSIAIKEAVKAQNKFQNKIFSKSTKVIKQITENIIPTVLLLGRPYNLYDPGLNLNIPAKLRDIYGMNVIPMDFLPLCQIDISSINNHMFWNYGTKIIQAARFKRDHKNLHIIYLSNFKCGPDSYIRHYIEDASEEPFLFLQLDSHANDAGIMTRIEAFLESKNMI